MRKILVKVKDGGCFFDVNHKGQTATGDRPYVLEESAYVNMAAAQGRLIILGEVKESCTDENFLKFYKNEKDKKAAVAKFLKAKETVKIEEPKEPVKTEEPKEPVKTEEPKEPVKTEEPKEPVKTEGNK